MSLPLPTPEVTQLTELEKTLLQHSQDIECWFREEWQRHVPPFYGSVDLRNSGYKISPIDMNLFPGGFNNLNPNFLMGAVIAATEAITRVCADAKRVLIIPENHTRNTFYLENVYTLAELFIRGGYQVRIGSLNPDITEKTRVATESGHSLVLEPLQRKNDRVILADGFDPCAIVLNNDLSAGTPDILQNLEQAVTPPLAAGWTKRRKSVHFRHFDTVMSRFSDAVSIDPWLINPYFDSCSHLNFADKNDNQELVTRAEQLFSKIEAKYKEYKIKEPPFIIMKADAGTYGMGIMTVTNPAELLNLNRKNRNKMATIKEGLAVHDVILQEGVYSAEKIADAVAEPVVYMIDKFVIGGFYRAHEGRSANENLNARGMKFVSLPTDISTVAKEQFKLDPKHHFVGWETQILPSLDKRHDDKANRFYVYGIIARLSLLAASLELEDAEAENASLA